MSPLKRSHPLTWPFGAIDPAELDRLLKGETATAAQSRFQARRETFQATTPAPTAVRRLAGLPGAFPGRS